MSDDKNRMSDDKNLIWLTLVAFFLGLCS